MATKNKNILALPPIKGHEEIDPYFYYLSYAFGGNLSSSGGDNNTEPRKETDTGVGTLWQGTRTGVAAINPIAGIIHAGAGMGESFGAKLDSDENRGANMSKATWDPFGAQIGVWGNKDATVGERVMAGLVPLSAGLINTKYDKKHAAAYARANAAPEVTTPQEFQGTMYGDGGPLDIIDINGPKHTEGGIPMGPKAEVEGGEVKVDKYIFSDQLEYSKGKTFADQAKVIHKRFKERDGDAPAQKTKLVQLEQLKAANETARQEKEKQDSYLNDLISADAKAYGGYIKLGKGGELEIDPSMRKTLTKTAKSRGMNTMDYATKLYACGGYMRKQLGNGGGDPTQEELDAIWARRAAGKGDGSIDDSQNNNPNYNYMDYKLPTMDEGEDPTLAPLKFKTAGTSSTKQQDHPKFGNEEMALGLSLLPATQNLAYSLKKPEKTKFEKVHPELISLMAERDLARKETNRSRTIARENIRGNSTNSGQVLSNLAAANSSLTENLMDKYTQSFSSEANANAQIRNNAAQMNTQIGNQEIIANEQNSAMAKSIGNKALADIGTNSQGYLRDKKLSSENARQNERTMQIINGIFPNYKWGADPEKDNQMLIAFKNQ